MFWATVTANYSVACCSGAGVQISLLLGETAGPAGRRKKAGWPCRPAGADRQVSQARPAGAGSPELASRACSWHRTVLVTLASVVMVVAATLHWHSSQGAEALISTESPNREAPARFDQPWPRANNLPGRLHGSSNFRTAPYKTQSSAMRYLHS